MKYLKYSALAFLLFILSHTLIAQRIESNTVLFKITNGKIERGAPPILYAELDYSDQNNNGILEGNEKSVLSLIIFNKGKGKAQKLKVTVTDDNYDRALYINDGIEISTIEPNSSFLVKIPVNASFNVKEGVHKLKINVTEHFGYDMDPAYLVLKTMEYQKPELVFAGMEIYDSGKGTSAIIKDGQLQAGELVKIKLMVQNIGHNSAENIDFKLFSTDENIYIDKIEKQKYTISTIKVGELIELSYLLSPNKRVTTSGELPIYFTAKGKYGYSDFRYKLPLKFGYQPPKVQIVEVKSNLEAYKNNVAKFEYSSSRFSINNEETINIELIEVSRTKRKKSVAVVIGVENYRNMPPAPYAANDAKLMEEYYKKKLGVEHVFLFTEQEVSGYFFPNTFNPASGELNKAIIQGETDLFVYYSGHGIPSKDGHKIYLMPYDGNISMLDLQGYNLYTFFDNLDQFGAKSVTVFLDACFSGSSKVTETVVASNLTGEKGVGIKIKMPNPWKNNPNYTVFTSSTGSQTSLAYDASKTGLFSYYLMAGLQGNADVNNDRKITMGELKDYVIKNVSSMSKRISGLQVPEFHGDESVVLVEY